MPQGTGGIEITCYDPDGMDDRRHGRYPREAERLGDLSASVTFTAGSFGMMMEGRRGGTVSEP